MTDAQIEIQVKREESRHDFAFIAGVVVGAVSGALATLALTPMSGSETRDKIRTRANEVDLGPVRERASGVATSAQTMVATGRERATQLAAKAPLPIGQRQQQGISGLEAGLGTDPLTGATTTPTSAPISTTLPPVSGGSEDDLHNQHTQDPAEGRTDVGDAGANRAGSESGGAGGGSQAPRPEEPAEGREDAGDPEQGANPSGSSNG